jgi:hypothetical protein
MKKIVTSFVTVFRVCRSLQKQVFESPELASLIKEHKTVAIYLL